MYLAQRALPKQSRGQSFSLAKATPPPFASGWLSPKMASRRLKRTRGWKATEESSIGPSEQPYISLTTLGETAHA
jgi:hypothetical protein